MKNKKILICCMVMIAFAIISGFTIRYTIRAHAEEPQLATRSDLQVATSSDASTDTKLYMSTYNSSATLADCYSMLLSIRNVLIMFFGFWFLTWAFSRLKIILRLFIGGRKK